MNNPKDVRSGDRITWPGARRARFGVVVSVKRNGVVVLPEDSCREVTVPLREIRSVLRTTTDPAKVKP